MRALELRAQPLLNMAGLIGKRRSRGFNPSVATSQGRKTLRDLLIQAMCEFCSTNQPIGELYCCISRHTLTQARDRGH